MTRYWMQVAEPLLKIEPPFDFVGLRVIEVHPAKNPDVRWVLFEDDKAPAQLEGQTVQLEISLVMNAPVITARRLIAVAADDAPPAAGAVLPEGWTPVPPGDIRLVGEVVIDAAHPGYDNLPAAPLPDLEMAIRAVLTRSLTEDTDGLGLLERPQDDSAMLDRALRLINDLITVLRESGRGDAVPVGDDGLFIEAASSLIREVLVAICERDSVSLDSTVEPGTAARNYELADRLGIGHVFALRGRSGNDS